MVSSLNPCGSMCYPTCLWLHGRSNSVLFTLAFPRFHGLFAQCRRFVQCSERNNEQSCSYAQFLLVYFLTFTSRFTRLVEFINSFLLSKTVVSSVRKIYRPRALHQHRSIISTTRTKNRCVKFTVHVHFTNPIIFYSEYFIFRIFIFFIFNFFSSRLHLR